MVAIYERKEVQSTTFQISNDLKYRLYHNEKGFRYVRYTSNGAEKPKMFWIDIPDEIATDVAAALLRGKNNGLISKKGFPPRESSAGYST